MSSSGSSSAAASLRFALALAVAARIAASVFAQRPRLASWSVARDGAEVGCWFWLGYAHPGRRTGDVVRRAPGFPDEPRRGRLPAARSAHRPQDPAAARVWLAAALAAAGVGALEVGGPVGAAPGDVIGLAQAAFFGMVRRRPTPRALPARPRPRHALAQAPPPGPQGFFRLERAMRVHGGADARRRRSVYAVSAHIPSAHRDRGVLPGVGVRQRRRRRRAADDRRVPRRRAARRPRATWRAAMDGRGHVGRGARSPRPSRSARSLRPRPPSSSRPSRSGAPRRQLHARRDLRRSVPHGRRAHRSRLRLLRRRPNATSSSRAPAGSCAAWARRRPRGARPSP